MKQTHIPYAVVTAIVMIIIGVALYMTGNSFNDWAKYVGLVPFLIGILLNAIAFSKANNHFVTFGNVFGSGFKATSLITLIMLVWVFIAMAIFPDMMTKGMEMARAAMVKKGNMTDDQIDQAMEFTRKYMKLFMTMGVIFLYVFWGAIFSLLGATIAQKKGNNPFQEGQSA